MKSGIYPHKMIPIRWMKMGAKVGMRLWVEGECEVKGECKVKGECVQKKDQQHGDACNCEGRKLKVNHLGAS